MSSTIISHRLSSFSINYTPTYNYNDSKGQAIMAYYQNANGTTAPMFNSGGDAVPTLSRMLNAEWVSTGNS